MKTLRLLFIISSFSNGVFGDTGEVKTVSVMEGDSVTLHNDTHIQTDDVIEWRFGKQGVLIAKLNREANETSIYNDVLDGRFRDRLQVDDQTGSLTITNIRTEDTGLYQIEITGKSITIRMFNISAVFGDTGGMKTVSVMERDSVTLHTDTHIQRADPILWRFQHHSPLAEINRAAGIFSTYDDVLDGRFKNKLQLDNQIGSLTIRNIRTKHSGLYEVDISSRTHTIHQSLTVTVRDAVKMMSVMEGDSVTLHTDVTEIQTYDLIQWMFGPDDTRIAEIYQPDKLLSTYDGDDGKFRDKLKLNDQTGDLTITNIRTEHSGVYELKISSRRRSIHRRISVTVSVSTEQVLKFSGVAAGIFVLLLSVITAGVIYCRHRFPKARIQEVMEGDSVILHTDVNTLKTDDEIEWRFEKTVITTIKRNNVNSAGERFRDRLTLRPQSGSLTISDIRTTDSGLYTLKHIRGRKTSYKRFRLTVTGTLKVITVNEGQSYTLQTHVTEIQTDDVIEWMFGDEQTLIAKIHKKNDISRTYDGDEDLFKNTLELKDQTGDLTIKNITNEHSGDYKLKTIRGGETSYRRFQLSVTESTGGADSVEINLPLMNGDAEQQ